jgi:predicted MFS family arabinose efflux permease
MLAGLGAATAGPWLVAVASTAAAATSSLLCVRLRPVTAGTAEQESAGWRSASRSLHLVRRDPRLLALVLVMSTQFIIGGALDVLAVAYSERVLSRGEAGAGLLVGSIGIGAVTGAMIAGRLTRSRRLTPVVVFGGILQGLAVALVAASHSTPAAVGAIALTGAGGALLTVAGRTLLQSLMDDGLLAGLFAVLESASLLGFAAGAAVAPSLILMFSAAGAFVPLGVAAAVVTAAAAASILRLDPRVPVVRDLRVAPDDVIVA